MGVQYDKLIDIWVYSIQWLIIVYCDMTPESRNSEVREDGHC
jgi:hypothetical protein